MDAKVLGLVIMAWWARLGVTDNIRWIRIKPQEAKIELRGNVGELIVNENPCPITGEGVHVTSITLHKPNECGDGEDGYAIKKATEPKMWESVENACKDKPRCSLPIGPFNYICTSEEGVPAKIPVQSFDVEYVCKPVVKKDNMFRMAENFTRDVLNVEESFLLFHASDGNTTERACSIKGSKQLVELKIVHLELGSRENCGWIKLFNSDQIQKWNTSCQEGTPALPWLLPIEGLGSTLMLQVKLTTGLIWFKFSAAVAFTISCHPLTPHFTILATTVKPGILETTSDTDDNEDEDDNDSNDESTDKTVVIIATSVAVVAILVIACLCWLFVCNWNTSLHRWLNEKRKKQQRLQQSLSEHEDNSDGKLADGSMPLSAFWTPKGQRSHLKDEHGYMEIPDDYLAPSSTATAPLKPPRSTQSSDSLAAPPPPPSTLSSSTTSPGANHVAVYVTEHMTRGNADHTINENGYTQVVEENGSFKPLPQPEGAYHVTRLPKTAIANLKPDASSSTGKYSYLNRPGKEDPPITPSLSHAVTTMATYHTVDSVTGTYARLQRPEDKLPVIDNVYDG